MRKKITKKSPAKKHSVSGFFTFREYTVIVGILILAVSALFLKITQGSAATTPPATGAYTTGVYRNLLKEAGYTDTDIQNKLNATWNQIFYGDTSTQAIYYPVGTDMAYMYAVDSNDVRTEGMSYGMMIALQMNKKAEFDRLWKWSKTYLQYQSGTRSGYFAWHARTDGTKIDANSAPDGETWYTTALFMAAGRWGNGTGIYNYKAEAQNILDNMRNKEATSSSTGIYDMFDPTTKLPRFSTETQGLGMTGFTDPSYVEPAFYDLWAVFANKDNTFWSSAATAGRQFLHTTVNTTTGLMPDYANFNGTPHACCSGNTTDHTYYSYDARRTGMNIGMDYHWFAKDTWQTAEANSLQNFFAAQGVHTFGSEYQLTGTQINSYHEAGHAAMLASTGLAGNTTHVNEFTTELWNMPIPSGQWRYYDGMLYMLGLLQTSGNFRMYGVNAPTPTVPIAPTNTPTPTLKPTATPTPAAKSLHVASLTQTVVPKSGGWYQGLVSVKVVDQAGNPLANTSVQGQWTGAVSQYTYNATTTSGVANPSSNYSKSKGPFTFCVTNLTQYGYTYNTAANVATCITTSY